MKAHEGQLVRTPKSAAAPSLDVPVPDAELQTDPVTPKVSPLRTVDGRPVRVVHLVAELAPFARSGGLGEAVSSLARFQCQSGVWTAIVMPLYAKVRMGDWDIEPLGAHFHVMVGNRSEEVRLWKLNPRPGDPLSRAHSCTARRARTTSTTIVATPVSAWLRSRRSRASPSRGR